MGKNYKIAATFTLSLLAGLTLLAAFSADAGLGQSAEDEQKRPNIVFVLTDDQMPGTENRMTALKRDVIEEGVKFTNMTSTFPLCCPGRATLLRGQYPHNTEIYGNSPPAGGWKKFQARDLHRSTFATWLDDRGYQTGHFGKVMNNYREKGKGSIPPGWDRWYAWNGVDMGWTSVNDQGKQKPLDRQEADSLVADEALGFLDSRLKGDSAPLLAYVNFGAMHQPYAHPNVDDKKFAGVNVPRTPAFNEEDVRDKPDYVSRLPKLSKKKVRRLDGEYRNGLRSLMRVDRFIADATDLLRRRGEMDNTYFVFYTDNGAHFGQHRFGHGKLQPYEEDVNFPLIVRGPGIAEDGEPGVNTELVGNHDIAPTLAEMAGVQPPAFVDGRSFLGLAKDPATPWPRTAILSERENDGEPPNRWDMLRMKDSEGVKVYTRHQNGDKEYYDLRQDPHQLHNALGPADTAYPPPDGATLDHYEERLDALYGCGLAPGSGHSTCEEYENVPLLPGGSAP